VKVYTPGQNRHVGNESLEVVGVRWHPRKNPFSHSMLFSLQPQPSLGVPKADNRPLVAS
jgi:hypothetical protein